MFKFKANKTLQFNGEGSKLQEDFFRLSRLSTFGFPHKPTALAWDPVLSLLAIGTQTGSLRVYGAPGVTIISQHKQPVSILSLILIPRKGRVVSLCSDNSLHLWELDEVGGQCELVEKKSYVMVGIMKKITAIFLKSSTDIIYLGTMCGNIYTLDVESFEMAETVIYQDVVIQNVPENVKLNPGGIKGISEQPGNPDGLLIGYQNGLMVLWDMKALLVTSTFVGSQNLESVAWHRRGNRFMSSHTDGSYVVWSTEDPSKPAEVPITLYGPFACKAINRIIWKSVKGGDDYVVFSGGMPRSEHGEKSTVSILCGDRHEVLDLPSKVVDFFTISDSCDESDFDNPHSLVLLLEDELIALDLESDSWLPYSLPYLDIPNFSPVTCAQFYPQIQSDVSQLLLSIQSGINADRYTESEWPIKGGKSTEELSLVKSLLVTGHENGGINLWNVSATSMQLLCSCQTSHTFLIYDKNEDSDEVEEWPPFRKIGKYDSSCDDSRLAIRKIAFNDLTKTLIVGGAAGHILVLNLSEVDEDKDVKPTIVHLVGDYNTVVYSGQSPLMVKPGSKKYGRGFQLQALVQLTPPVPITALDFHPEWNILAAGTAHGFLLFDVTQRKSIMSKCTLGIGDVALTSGEVSPRSQTIKRSLRESFRKLRKGKMLRNGRDRTGSLCSELSKERSQDAGSKRESLASSPDPTIGSSPSPELRSFTSESDTHQGNGTLNSVVQCVYLAQSFIINSVITTPTFWAGTSNGFVYIYTITVPAGDARVVDLVSCQLGKEIQLKHRAPILSIQIVDHRGYPLPDPLAVQHQRAKPADLCRSHRVVICTEEQIKVFTLPSMKPFCKYKMMLLERCHVTQVGFATFQSRSDPKNTENCVVCLTNSQEITLYSIPDLRKKMSFQYVSCEDIGVLSSFMFVNDGRFVFMVSPSEFQMCSLGASITARPSCSIEIPADARVSVKPIDNIVIQVHNIALEESSSNYKDRMTKSSADESESSETSARNSVSQGIFQPPINGETNDNGDSHSVPGSGLTQIRRAPLARIDELNSSDEYQPSCHDSMSS